MEEILSQLDELYPIIQTQLEMLRDNGYNLTSDELKLIHSTEDEKKYNNFITTYANKFINETNEKKYVTIYEMFSRRFTKRNSSDTFVYYLDPKINKGKDVNIQDVKNLIYFLGIVPTDILFITKTKLNKSAGDELRKFNYRHFLFTELQYNVTKHILSPKYELLDDAQKILFLRSNDIEDPEKIPKIKDDDMITRYYNAKLGQIFRITQSIVFYESIVKKRMGYRIVTDS